jgi:hypothetical protein
MKIEKERERERERERQCMKIHKNSAGSISWQQAVGPPLEWESAPPSRGSLWG